MCVVPEKTLATTSSTSEQATSSATAVLVRPHPNLSKQHRPPPNITCQNRTYILNTFFSLPFLNSSRKALVTICIRVTFVRSTKSRSVISCTPPGVDGIDTSIDDKDLQASAWTQETSDKTNSVTD